MTPPRKVTLPHLDSGTSGTQPWAPPARAAAALAALRAPMPAPRLPVLPRDRTGVSLNSVRNRDATLLPTPQTLRFPATWTVTSEVPRGGVPTPPPLHPGERRPKALWLRGLVTPAAALALSPTRQESGVPSHGPEEQPAGALHRPKPQQHRGYLLHGMVVSGASSMRAGVCVCPVSPLNPHSQEVLPIPGREHLLSSSCRGLHAAVPASPHCASR